jgi:YidC/Oxa1 family membrane protein insertase
MTELDQLYRYIFKIPKSEKEIVFYAEYAGSLPAFEGLIAELRKRYDRPFCYITSDPRDPILKTKDPQIRSFYFNKIVPFVMASIDAEIVLMTMPALNMHDIRRSPRDVHYIYVFHAAHGCNATYEFGAFEHYDSILCVGPHHVDELRRQEELYGFRLKELVEAGFYRIERIYRAYKAYEESHRKKVLDKDVVMFAPTWEQNFTLSNCATPIVDSLRDKDYEVIVRLHPETCRRYSEWVSAFYAEHEEDPGFTLETAAVTDESLFRADVLITDWSGITPEYAYGTERPVLFLDGMPQKINNPRYDELGIEPNEVTLRQTVGNTIPIDEISNIDRHVRQIMAEHDNFRSKIQEMRSKYLFNFGRSSEVGVDHILEVIDSKRESP